MQDYAVDKSLEVYMIVGIYTLMDANAAGGSFSTGKVHGQAAAPSETGIEAGAAVAMAKTRAQRSSFIAPGEQIFAIEYRKVVFKWFYSKNSNQAYLQRRHNRWQIFWGQRAEGTEDDLVDEVMEGEPGGPVREGKGDETTIEC